MRSLRHYLSLVLLFLGLISANLAFAVKLGGLYTAQVPVAAQTPDLRAEAMRTGLLSVLVKVSGNPNIGDLPAIKTSLKRAEYYVQEYSYSAATVDTSTYTLNIQFDEDDINRLLKSAGAVYWGDTRPSVMVWLAVTDADNQTDIIGNETPGAILESMKAEGKQFGLPLIFPVMNADELSAVPPTDVISANLPALNAASKPYTADALLAGSIQPADKGFTSHWVLVLKDTQWRFTIPGDTLTAILQGAVQQVSQTLSAKYMDKTTQAATASITVVVNNVSADHDLENLMAYLKQLTPVQQVELAQVDGNTVSLRIEVKGSIDTFEQNATIGQKLIFKSQDDEKQTLVFDWAQP